MDQGKLISILQQIRDLVDEGMDELGRRDSQNKKSAAPRVKRSLKATRLSFTTNVLAFMKKHTRGLSGHQKFTLLLGRLAKGSVLQRVPSAEVEKHWNKMKVVLGGKFNRAYANRAKAEGWVDTPKHGLYTLSPSWKEALTKDNE